MRPWGDWRPASRPRVRRSAIARLDIIAEAAPCLLGVSRVSVVRSKQARVNGNVVELPAKAIEGEHRGVDASPGGVRVEGQLVAIAGDQPQVALGWGQADGVPVDQKDLVGRAQYVAGVRLPVRDHEFGIRRGHLPSETVESLQPPQELRG